MALLKQLGKGKQMTLMSNIDYTILKIVSYVRNDKTVTYVGQSEKF